MLRDCLLSPKRIPCSFASVQIRGNTLEGPNGCRFDIEYGWWFRFAFNANGGVSCSQGIPIAGVMCWLSSTKVSRTIAVGEPKLSNGQELQNPVLDILQSVLDLIQNLLGVNYRVVLSGKLTPRDLCRKLNVGGCDLRT
jgi:hypothetical protein